MPKVSVIVPIYGVEKYLREALDSVINQTLKDIEILLIDDGGKDNCPQIIDEYAARDLRIIAIHKPNGGYGQSCNVGLERATGEYVAIMEPDDYIDSHMYEDLYNIAKENDSDIVKSPYISNFEDPLYKLKRYEDFAKKFEIPQKAFTIFEAPQLLYYHPSIWSAIYKKEFLDNKNIRFKEVSGAGWTDNPFQVQTMCLAEKINYTSKAYYYWRVLHRNAAKELKDYRIPFERCAEIREWMKSNGFYVQELLSAYYQRELGYLSIVLMMKNIPDEDDFICRIIDMVGQMSSDIVQSSKYITKKNKKLYLFLKKSAKNVYKKSRFKIILKDINDIKQFLIRLKISKKGISLYIFNRLVFEKCSDNC